MAITEQERPARTVAAKTMRAAVVQDFARPLALKQVARPVAGQGEIVVRIQTSGLCHTDIHAAHGDWPIKLSPPFIPGHEGIGVVEELGPTIEAEVAMRRCPRPRQLASLRASRSSAACSVEAARRRRCRRSRPSTRSRPAVPSACTV